MSDDCQDFFTNNTDIVGIGVRVAFYMQINLLVLLVMASPRDSPGAGWTLTAMTLGLLIASFVSVSQNQLSFYNAIQVENLVWFANLGQQTVLWTATYSRHPLKRQEKVLQIIYITAYRLSAILTIVLWAKAYHFGPDTECIPLIKFYFFFWKVSISFHRIRVIALVLYSFGLWSALTGFGGFGSLSRRKFRSGDHLNGVMEREALAQGVRITNALKDAAALYTRIWYLIPWFFLQFFYIPPLELFLRQYPQPDDATSQWGFGQILAMVAVIPTLMSAIFAVKDMNWTIPRTSSA